MHVIPLLPPSTDVWSELHALADICEVLLRVAERNERHGRYPGLARQVATLRTAICEVQASAHFWEIGVAETCE